MRDTGNDAHPARPFVAKPVRDNDADTIAELSMAREPAKVEQLVFEFLPDGELAAADVAALRRFRGWLPCKYTKDPSSCRQEPRARFNLPRQGVAP